MAVTLAWGSLWSKGLWAAPSKCSCGYFRFQIFPAQTIAKLCSPSPIPSVQAPTHTGTNNLHLFFFLAVPCSMWDLKFHSQGVNPQPLYWKLRVLTTGPPGKSSVTDILMLVFWPLFVSSYLAETQEEMKRWYLEFLTPYHHVFSEKGQIHSSCSY